MDTDLRDFSIMIPRLRITEASNNLIKRIETFIQLKDGPSFDGWYYQNSEILFNYILISGKAPVEIVTVLAAFAQGHDVVKILDAFET